MAIWNRRTSLPTEENGIVGTLRFARRGRDVASLREGDIAVVDHPELDGRQAEALIERRVRAVLNTAPSSSGRIPNTGPQQLSRAGITLIDLEGEDPWSALKNGERVRIEDGKVYRNEILVISGTELDEERTTTDLAGAESGLATRLDSLAANATDHIQREHEMLLSGARVPHLRTKLRHRVAVVVSRAHDAEADLRALRRYIADTDPVLVGAGPGADVLLAAGYTPHLVVGAVDDLSDRAIRAAGEVVVTTTSGRVDMPERLERHGKEIAIFVSAGSDDDLAILLADTNDAVAIVHVGAPSSLADFLDGSPTEVARMFVARLRAAAKVVDAKAVQHFVGNRFTVWPILLLLLAGVIAVAVAVAVTPVGQDWYDALGDRLGDVGTWIKGLFT